MGRDREVDFHRSVAQNLHTFHWDFQNTKQFPIPFDPQTAWQNVQDQPLLTTLEGPERPLRVRVAFSDTLVTYPQKFVSTSTRVAQVALSPEVVRM
jgi:hypothetical protein